MCFLCLQIVLDHLELHIGRHGDIDHLDRAAAEHLFIRVVRLPGHAARPRAGAWAGVREAIATGLKPAFWYATRWQSAMMNPLPMQPMGTSLCLGRRGR